MRYRARLTQISQGTPHKRPGALQAYMLGTFSLVCDTNYETTDPAYGHSVRLQNLPRRRRSPALRQMRNRRIYVRYRNNQASDKPALPDCGIPNRLDVRPGQPIVPNKEFLANIFRTAKNKKSNLNKRPALFRVKFRLAPSPETQQSPPCLFVFARQNQYRGRIRALLAKGTHHINGHHHKSG